MTSRQSTDDLIAEQPSEDSHILVVDDDPRLRRLLQRYLTGHGYRISVADSAEEASNILSRILPDAIVLDITMPGEDGLHLINRLRSEGFNLPIVLLTARGEPADRIAGLEAGADDYLGKPFEPKELLLRLRAHLRRITTFESVDNMRIVRLGPLYFDPTRSILSGPDGGVIYLTGGEAALLAVLCHKPGEVLARDTIMRALRLEEIGERAVDVQITRLRRKIEPNIREPKFLQTVRGKGYVIKPGL